MKKILLNIFILLFFITIPLVSQQVSRTACFIENKGQWNSQVRYMFKNANYYAWITDFGIVYNYYKFTVDTLANDTILSGNVIRMSFENSSGYSYITSGELTTKHNYFYGNISATNVSLFSEITAINVYPNVDVRYYIDSTNGYNLRYDFIVKPGANVNNVCYRLEGVDSITTKNNELILVMNNCEYRHTNLQAYQQNANDKNEVSCDFAYSDVVSFNVGDYDNTKTLIIDPLIYSVLLGGMEFDAAYSIAVDNIGSAYITGETKSIEYPVTSGSYSTSLSSNGSPIVSSDCFVSKVAPNGKTCYFSTYLGGTQNDVGRYIKVDNDWNIYVVGETQSNQTIPPNIPFPVLSSNTYLSSYHGGWETFVTKLNPTGNAINFSVLLGGSANDYAGGFDFLLDSVGNVIYIAVALQVTINAGDVPPITTPGTYKSTISGITDCYLAIINGTGSILQWASFFGGSADEKPYSLAVHSESYVNEANIPVTNYYIYVTGITTSVDFPTTPDVVQSAYGGNTDGFVFKINNLLTAPNYSTYLGGNKQDSLRSIAVDSDGNAYITGFTMSSNFPCSTHIGGIGLKADTANIVVAKLNQGGTILNYSTNITSNANNYANDIVVDSAGNAHIAGYTTSNTFPATADAFFIDYSEYGDAIYSVLNPTGNTLVFSSFIGGYQYEYGFGLALDTLGAAYICGRTLSADNFPHSHIFADSQMVVRLDTIYDSASGEWIIYPVYESVKTLGNSVAFIYKATYRPYPGELVTNIDTLGSSYCPGETVTVHIWTPYGFYYDDNIFYVQLSNADGNFPATPLVIGSLAGTVGGTTSITFPATLTPSFNYHIRVYATHPRAYGFPNSIPITVAPAFILLDSTSIPTTICAGDEISIKVNSNKCFNAGNTFRLELSDASGSFSTPLTLATSTGSGTLVMSAIFPTTLTPSSNYKIRCVSTNPVVTSNILSLNINSPTISVNSNYLLSLQGLCAGSSFDFGFDATSCFASNNRFYLVLSDITGSFNNAVDTLGFVNSVGATPTVLNCKLPNNLPYSTNYKIKLVATNPNMEVVLNATFAFGKAYIDVAGLADLSFCLNFNYSLHINANDCFNANNIFECYVKAGLEWILVGSSKNKDISITIPYDIRIGDTAILQMRSTSPVLYTEEVKAIITSPTISIASTTPYELCSGDAFVASYKTNGCIKDTLDVVVELSVGSVSFITPTTIGAGKVFGANGNITCQLPNNIDENYAYYIRLKASNGLTSTPFKLNINPPDMLITSDMTDLQVLCTGISFYIDFTTIGCFDIDNVFQIVLSDVLGQFGTSGSRIIGEITSNKSVRIFVQIPLDMPEGNVYRIMITSSHPQMQKIINFHITLKHPFITIDSTSNVEHCDPYPIPASLGMKLQTLDDNISHLSFNTSDCFGKDNKFVLEIARNADFSDAIAIDTIAWNEREFNFKLPDWLGQHAYRLRVVSTNPKIASGDNGFDIKYNQPFATLTTDSNLSICRDMPYTLTYATTDCFDDGNIFYLEMSDATGSFADPQILDYTSNKGEGVFNAIIPEYCIAGNTYKLRIRSTSPAMIFHQTQITLTVNGPQILTGNLFRPLYPRNDTLFVPFEINCFNPEGKLFVVQLSDPYGTFQLNQILEIGNKIGWEDSIRPGKIYARIWLQASDGKGYRVRVVCKNPNIIGKDNGKDITIFGMIIKIDDEKSSGFVVFPLPFEDILHIELNEQTYTKINLIDLLGRVVLTEESIGSAYDLQTNMLPSGTYYLQVQTDKETYRKVLIKK